MKSTEFLKNYMENGNGSDGSIDEILFHCAEFCTMEYGIDTNFFLNETSFVPKKDMPQKSNGTHNKLTGEVLLSEDLLRGNTYEGRWRTIRVIIHEWTHRVISSSRKSISGKLELAVGSQLDKFDVSSVTINGFTIDGSSIDDAPRNLRVFTKLNESATDLVARYLSGKILGQETHEMFSDRGRGYRSIAYLLYQVIRREPRMSYESLTEILTNSDLERFVSEVIGVKFHAQSFSEAFKITRFLDNLFRGIEGKHISLRDAERKMRNRFRRAV
jgi:hypothetical protein